jgi:hypothetical protein
MLADVPCLMQMIEEAHCIPPRAEHLLYSRILKSLLRWVLAMDTNRIRAAATCSHIAEWHEVKEKRVNYAGSRSS